MEKIWKAAHTKLAVSIYSNPRFVFETLVVSIFCLIFYYVCVNFKYYYSRNKKRNKCAPLLERIALKRSSSSSTTDTFYSNMACAGSCYDLHDTTSSITHMSNEKYDFFTYDEFLTVSHKQSSVKTLRNLCNEIIEKKSSELAVRRHLDMAREHLQLAKCCLGSGDNESIIKLTDTLYELLERIILSNCDRKQFPFRDDMASLAAEIAELSLDVR